MKLKTNINSWDIFFKENKMQFSTCFNSGFIDDIDVVKKYFKKIHPNAKEVTIKHLTA